jgi:hypothetical protein
MFDDLTFALRYESVIKIGFMSLLRVIPVPVTRGAVEQLKRDGVWKYFEPIIGPYLDEE